MGEIAQNELLSSLSRLYSNAEYTDLTISSRTKDYRVHKAIVCPRSTYFATECRRASSEAPNAGLSLRGDDPQAVDSVMQYLYHLDYPVTRASENGHGTNGIRRPEVNGHEESVAASEDRATESITDPVDGPVDEFLPITPTKSKNKKRRKKKGAAASDATTADGGIPDAPGDDALPENADEELPHDDAVAPHGSLVTHATVYQLSKKYGIEGLESLALDKFRGEAEERWATDDFLQAAKTVYSTPNQEGEDRKMKDLVTDIFYLHLDLLDRPETQNVIRGLDLGLDVLMRVHKQGVKG